MANIRLRHPQGVSTLQIPLDNDAYTVQDLLQEIYSLTNILPSRQTLKTGYPPRTLNGIIPELSVSSLGFKSGEQIIVSGTVEASSPSPVASSTTPAPARSVLAASVPTPASAAGTPEHVAIDDSSFLVHRVVPDDNSCLFSSVALIFEGSTSKASDLRKIVADGILADPETYNEAILGMKSSIYISKILDPMAWGGAIELGILAAHYRTEICSIDVETGRVDQFSPASGAQSMRCIVIYSGIHYDAATLAPMAEAPDEWHQRVFAITSSGDSDPVLQAGKKLAALLRAKKAYTNTSTFDLKCEQCGKGLKGEKEARAHAEATGHVKFGEY